MIEKNYFQNTLAFLFGLTLMIVGSKVTIAAGPIPFTLQTYMLLLVILLFSPKLSLGIVSTYLVLGGVGLPVFTVGKLGISAFTGVGGGYLWGFLIATIILALPFFRRRTFITMCCWGILAHAIILACGVLQFAFLKTLKLALTHGFYPFLLPALAKSILAAVTIIILNSLRPSAILARKLRS